MKDIDGIPHLLPLFPPYPHTPVTHHHHTSSHLPVGVGVCVFFLVQSMAPPPFFLGIGSILPRRFVKHETGKGCYRIGKGKGNGKLP